MAYSLDILHFANRICNSEVCFLVRLSPQVPTVGIIDTRSRSPVCGLPHNKNCDYSAKKQGQKSHYSGVFPYLNCHCAPAVFLVVLSELLYPRYRIS